MKDLNRRKFIRNGITATVGSMLMPGILLPAAAESRIQDQSYTANLFQFSQVKLPYGYNALEPHIDALTMEIHYSKHHTAYIKNVNDAIAAEKLNFKDALDFFNHASILSPKARNNGGGAWNHNFFWESMQPAASNTIISKKIKTAIEKDFGSVDQFKQQFTQAALSRFGSGWAWLVNQNGKLLITSTANQDNPLMDNAAEKGTPLLALDVWEHAYYLKYQNKRNDYVDAWWSVVNWQAVEKRLG